MERIVVDCQTNETSVVQMTAEEEAAHIASLEGIPTVVAKADLTAAQKLERTGLTVDELRGLLGL